LSEPESNAAGWVRVVATNLARSRWRQLRRASRSLFPPRSREESHPVSDPGLLAALEQLAPRQRQAVILRYWADLKLEDCAEVMGVSVGSVKKQHLARAHDRLAAMLDRSELEELTL
jgi:RNA polymerase sigma-70 factor (ECF subfamily)